MGVKKTGLVDDVDELQECRIILGQSGSGISVRAQGSQSTEDTVDWE
jgi:hypothetical protein